MPREAVSRTANVGKEEQMLEMPFTEFQVFIDGSDAYVWMYEPMPTWYYAAGFMCLLGAVAICLFPLWPPIVR